MLTQAVDIDQPIFLTNPKDYSSIGLRVMSKGPGTLALTCVVVQEGPLSANMLVNLPGLTADDLELPPLTQKDRRDLMWGVQNDVDIVAASAIRSASDVRTMFAYLERCMERHARVAGVPMGVRPLVIAKIENAEAVQKFDEIIKEADGIMIARGDLGVEIAYPGQLRVAARHCIPYLNAFITTPLLACRYTSSHVTALSTTFRET